MEYINQGNLTQNQKNLLDLKIRLVKACFELNFSLTGYKNLNQRQFDSSYSTDRIFMDSYVSLIDNDLFDFIKKIDRNQLNTLTYNPNDLSVTNFLKGLEDIKNLDDDEILIQKGRIEKKIKEIEGAASEIENILLGSLPRNYYTS